MYLDKETVSQLIQKAVKVVNITPLLRNTADITDARRHCNPNENKYWPSIRGQTLPNLEIKQNIGTLKTLLFSDNIKEAK